METETELSPNQKYNGAFVYSASVFELPYFFDDSVYLADRKIPPKLAILETNRLLAERADVIVSGVSRTHGGAFLACEHAKKNNKQIINIFE